MSGKKNENVEMHGIYINDETQDYIIVMPKEVERTAWQGDEAIPSGYRRVGNAIDGGVKKQADRQLIC